MPLPGPWFFAWVDENTPFDPGTHNRMDEYVFSLRRILSEGDKPRLEMTIRNPHIGLLNDGRKQWAWLSRDVNGTITPVFYGRLKAAPKDIFKELMTIDLVAWPLDYNRQRQKLAAEIRDTGPYDPVFIETAKRDDPDVLLEAVSGLYHVDPVTHVVSISDILNGEDGNVDVTADDHFYEGMNADFDQTNSLTAILMDATVTWNQTGQGYIDLGHQQIQTYAGDAVISEWPQPLTSLGGGWTVAVANAVDSNGVNSVTNGSFSISWTNKEKEHSDGDQLTLNISMNVPVGLKAGSQRTVLNFLNQTGFLDPFATDGNGDPSPTNIPAVSNVTYAYVPIWSVSATLMLRYGDLDRQRSERVQMLLQSDLQPIIVRPEVEQNSETIVKTGADVGIPIINLLNRTGLDGEAVDIDVIIFPDNPSLPGLRSAQIVTTAGTLALEQPNYSDIQGETTVDGTAVLTSLGTPAPTETAFDWPANTFVDLGDIILPRKPLTLTWRQLTQGGRQQFPAVGSQLSRGTLIRASNGSYQVCTLGGLSKLSEPAFTTSRGAVVADGSAQWTCLGTSLPDGKTHFLCVQAGKTGAQFLIPQFNNALHARTTDGTAIWAAIGTGDIPAGGTPGDVWARSYFTTARGNKSLEYLISIMRARARLKARAVNIDFTMVDPFGKGLDLTLRKTVSLHDPRLAGGIGTGKLISIEHRCDGRTGREECLARIGCAIGKDTTIEAVPGNPTYCNGYVRGYRRYTDVIKVISDESDVGYTPPFFKSNDDDLIFPLTNDQVVLSEGIRGSLSAQAAAVASVLGNMAGAARLGARPTGSIDASAAQAQQIAQLSGFNISTATALNPIWYDLVMKPLSGWQFDNFYKIDLTKLTVQKGIDLGGASTP